MIHCSSKATMKTKLLLLYSIVTALGPVSAADSTNRLHFPVAGFSIERLDAAPGNSTQQALMLFLEPTDGFAANVNVQIQPYTGTIDEFVALTLQQFKDAGIKVLQQKSQGKTSVLMEYAGEIQRRPLHWYARAEKSADRVYLVTATAMEQRWEKEAARLKACVD